MNTFKRSLVASIAAGVILAGGGAPAFAQPTTVGAAGIPVTQDQINSLVRTNQDEADLTIHKYSHKLDGSEQRGNGEALTPAPTFPTVEGAQYKIERIDADLKTNEGWRKASKIAAGTETATVINITGTEASRTVTTNGQGIGTTTLPLGLYRVTELAAPGHEVNAEPFYVTLPMTNVDGDAWNYDVHVYPKNTPDDRKLFTKDVKDANSHAFVSPDSYTGTPVALVKGDNVTYPISSRVENGTLEYYRIEDHFDGTRLRQRTAGEGQNGETALVTNVRVTNEDNGVLATLSAGDYGVSLENAGTENAYLAVELTPQGLAKLNGTTGQRRLAFEFNAELVEIPGADRDAALASVDNTDLRLWQRVGQNPPTTPNTPVTTTPPATNTPPTTSTPATNTPPPGTDTPEPFTRSFYGNVKIQKQNNAGENLQGAQFDLYKCTNQDGQLTLDQETGALGTATSGADGLAYFSGVHANNFVDNEAVDPGNNGYCIVETQAPRVAVVDADGNQTDETANYELLAQPVFFQVIADTKNNTVPLTVIKTDQTVNQPEKGGFQLPFTGGNGAYWLLGLGVLSLLVAFGAQEKRRRQQA